MEGRSESWFCGEVKILLRKDLTMLIYNENMLAGIGCHMNMDLQKMAARRKYRKMEKEAPHFVRL